MQLIKKPGARKIPKNPREYSFSILTPPWKPVPINPDDLVTDEVRSEGSDNEHNPLPQDRVEKDLLKHKPHVNIKKKKKIREHDGDDLDGRVII